VHVLDRLGCESRCLGYRDASGPVPGHRLTGRVDRYALDLCSQIVRGEVTPGRPLRLDRPGSTEGPQLDSHGCRARRRWLGALANCLRERGVYTLCP